MATEPTATIFCQGPTTGDPSVMIATEADYKAFLLEHPSWGTHVVLGAGSIRAPYPWRGQDGFLLPGMNVSKHDFFRQEIYYLKPPRFQGEPYEETELLGIARTDQDGAKYVLLLEAMVVHGKLRELTEEEIEAIL